MFSWFCKMHQSILPVDFICFIVDTLLLRNLQRSWEKTQKYRFCNVNAAKSNFEALWYIIHISLLGFCKDLLRWQYVQIPRETFLLVKTVYDNCDVSLTCFTKKTPFNLINFLQKPPKMPAQESKANICFDKLFTKSC